MGITDIAAAPPKSPSRNRTRFTRLIVTLVAASALTFGAGNAAFAASGAQTGEWDVVATSQAQTPKLQSFNHTAEAWDTVTSPTSWFAVGSGKVINGNEAGTTPVKGGGIRFVNTATTAKTATFTFAVPANVGLKIQTLGGATVVSSPASSSARTVSWTTPSVAAGASFHDHFTWTFSGTGTATAAHIGVSTSVSGSGTTVGNYTASATYRFTF
jgi:hypothetical protein